MDKNLCVTRLFSPPRSLALRSLFHPFPPYASLVFPPGTDDNTGIIAAPPAPDYPGQYKSSLCPSNDVELILLSAERRTLVYRVPRIWVTDIGSIGYLDISRRDCTATDIEILCPAGKKACTLSNLSMLSQ